MSAVISAFVTWMVVVVLLGVVAVAAAPRMRVPHRVLTLGRAMRAAVEGSAQAVGRPMTSTVVLLACWAVVIIVGCLLGILAHRLQGAIDEPAFRWWQSRHRSAGSWTTVWERLTNIGSTTLTMWFAVIGALVLLALYFRLRYRWLPSVLLIVGYLATKYAQTIVKVTVNRGHPPTSLGTWPSGGVSRVIVIYGLIMFFLILRFRPRDRRAWLVGATVIAMLSTIQAYARLYNLEHWTTDVIGGFFFGPMLLITMILGYLSWAGSVPRPSRPLLE